MPHVKTLKKLNGVATKSFSQIHGIYRMDKILLQQVFEADYSWLFEAVLKNCNARLVKNCDLRKASKMGFKMYIFVKKFVQNNKTYYYLVIEHYNPLTKRKKVLFQVSLKKILEAFKSELNCESETHGFGWCGGWGLNPRRPTPSGPKPDPFDLARAPPRPVFGALCILGRI